MAADSKSYRLAYIRDPLATREGNGIVVQKWPPAPVAGAQSNQDAIYVISITQDEFENDTIDVLAARYPYDAKSA